MKEVSEEVIKLLLKIYKRQEEVPDNWFENYIFNRADQAKFHIYQLNTVIRKEQGIFP